ncbi:MAG: carboxypeptidase-like regulatory domain-containing protein [Acidimicrobiales bacterium]
MVPAGTSAFYPYRVVGGCQHGANVKISPPRIAALGPTVTTSDGRIAGFVLNGVPPGKATVTVSRDGKVLATISVIVLSNGSTPPSTKAPQATTGSTAGAGASARPS